MRAAAACIATYANDGHENPRNLLQHPGTSEQAYVSDYPALFHLLGAMDAIRTILDLGGNAGNVFYRFGRSIDWGARVRICALVAAGPTMTFSATSSVFHRHDEGRGNEFTVRWRDPREAGRSMPPADGHPGRQNR